MVVVGVVGLASYAAYQGFGSQINHKITCFASKLQGDESAAGCGSGDQGLSGEAGFKAGGHVDDVAPPKGATNTHFDGPAFIKGDGDASGAAPNDLSQGELGDCYLISSMGAIATKDPQVLEKLITKNDDGTYTVHFKPNKNVTVTPDFPTKNGYPMYLQPGDSNKNGQQEIWPMLIEKAYAKSHGGYKAIDGGFMSDALHAMTGLQGDSFDNTVDFNTVYNEWKHGWAVTGGTLSDKDAKNNPLFQDDQHPPLVSSHAYYVTAMDPKNKTVTLQNPWGWDGYSTTLSWDDYQSAFTMTQTNPIVKKNELNKNDQGEGQ